MTHVLPTYAVDGEFKRVCDICGIRFLSRDLVYGSDGKWRCKQFCAEMPESEHDQIELDAKRSASKDELSAPPWARDAEYLPNYEVEESEIFNLMTQCETPTETDPDTYRKGSPPWRTVLFNGTRSPFNPTWNASGPPYLGGETPFCAGAAINYLYGIIVEDERPQTWITAARAKLVELADWLLSRQYGESAGESYMKSASTSYEYGMFSTMYAIVKKLSDAGAIVLANDYGFPVAQSYGMLGLLRAYQVTGEDKYLKGARRAATCLRRMQCGGSLTSGYAVKNAASARVPHGPLLEYVSISWGGIP